MAVSKIGWQRAKTARRRVTAAMCALAVAAAVLVVGDVRAVSAQSDAFAITGLRVVSTPAHDGVYGVGETILIEAAFNRRVLVRGGDAPALGFQLGGRGAAGWRAAPYLYRPDTQKLVFGYQVQPSDRDTVGIFADGGWQDGAGNWHNLINRDRIAHAQLDWEDNYRRAGDTVSPDFPGLGVQSGHKVDGSLSPVGTASVSSSPFDGGDTHDLGETVLFDVKFSAPVDVTGTPHLSLRVGDDGGSGWRAAAYQSGSGSETLTFGYEVQSGDRDADGVTLVGTWREGDSVRGIGGGATFKVAGTDWVVEPEFGGLANVAGHKVNGGAKPSLVGVASVSSSPFDGGDTHDLGETVLFDVEFSAPVDVTGTPHLSLRVGDGGGSGWRGATYRSGSGSDTLTFGYEVQSGDRDADGVTLVGTWREGDSVRGIGGGATFKVAGTDLAVEPEFGGLANVAGHKVDGGAKPTPVGTASVSSSPQEGGTIYRFGETVLFDVEFDVPIDVTGVPHLSLRVGDSSGSGWRAAAYRSGSGSDTLTFGYAVQRGDTDVDGVTLVGTWHEGSAVAGWGDSGGSGYGFRAAGADLDVVPFVGAVNNAAGHQIDGRTAESVAPTVESVKITSRRPHRYPYSGGSNATGPRTAGHGYGLGNTIEVTATFSEPVVVEGVPRIEITIGSDKRQATYSSTDGAKVKFEYVVEEDDHAPWGMEIAADSISLESGAGEGVALVPPTIDEDGNALDDLADSDKSASPAVQTAIRDVAGNAAVLTHGAVGRSSGQLVDAVAPRVTRVSLSKPAWSHGKNPLKGPGDHVSVDIEFSESLRRAGGGDDHDHFPLGIGLQVGDRLTSAGAWFTDGWQRFRLLADLDPSDVDTDGVSVPADSLFLVADSPHPPLMDFMGNPIRLTNPAVSDHSDFLVVQNPPSLKSVAITSAGTHRYDLMGPGRDPGIGYITGETIEVTATFNLPVVVEGAPEVALTLSDTQTRNAVYSSSDGAEVKFEYVVQAGDFSGLGVQIAANAVSLTPGSDRIRDESGNDAAVTHAAVPRSTYLEGEFELTKVHHLVDAVAPTITILKVDDTHSVGSGPDGEYVVGDFIDIELTFSEILLGGRPPDGIPQIGLQVGDDLRTVPQHFTDDGQFYLLRYTVQSGDFDGDGVSIPADSLSLARGNPLTDLMGNALVLTNPAVDDQSSVIVNTPSALESIEITSEATHNLWDWEHLIDYLGDDDFGYGIGETIEVTATFNQDVTVTGTPIVLLRLGGDTPDLFDESGNRVGTAAYTNVTARYVRQDGNDTAVFAYTVQAGDADGDGVEIVANSVTVPTGATINGADGRATKLEHPHVEGTRAHMVDGLAPVVDRIEFSWPSDEQTGSTADSDVVYGVGDTIEVVVWLDEWVDRVDANGNVLAPEANPETMSFTFMLGGTERTAVYSTDESVFFAFEYTVVLGDLDSDGLSFAADQITLNGVTLVDDAGNNAVLTHDASGPQSSRTVRTTGGL